MLIIFCGRRNPGDGTPGKMQLLLRRKQAVETI